jgi:hypothetical protein
MYFILFTIIKTSHILIRLDINSKCTAANLIFMAKLFPFLQHKCHYCMLLLYKPTISRFLDKRRDFIEIKQQF